MRPTLCTLAHFVRKIQPRQCVAHGANLVAYAVQRVVAHTRVQVIVGPEIVQVSRNGVRVADVDQEPVLAVLDLQRDTARACGDDGLPLVQGFGDFDFEAFATGELEGDTGAREEGVEDLV